MNVRLALLGLLLAGCGRAQPAADSTAMLPAPGVVKPDTGATLDTTPRLAPATPATSTPPARTVRPDTARRVDTPLQRRDSVIQRRPLRVPTIQDTARPKPPA